MGLKKGNVAGEWRRLHNEKLYDLNCSPHIMLSIIKYKLKIDVCNALHKYVVHENVTDILTPRSCVISNHLLLCLYAYIPLLFVVGLGSHSKYPIVLCC